MSEAQHNDTVQVHYTGTLDDGSVFDSSHGGDPLQFTLGANQVIPGFEDAILGMRVGDTKNIHIPVDQAYGESNADMLVEFPLEQFPSTPDLGQQVTLQAGDGQTIPATVVVVSETHATLDANHPLAGQALNFALELVGIG